ncbi:MAG TPA: DEAD/DEAH box helicase [Thermoanaerobaculia bacterium]|jgi:superfamily II DNA or RNA helicase|nr:DEAD/DEAH box helicase [Thermoanaerobaculia bacterium]
MPRTRTTSKLSKDHSKRQKAAPRPQGWRTTDDEEIERRRHRAATEPLRVEPIEPGHRVFGTFRVGTDGGSSYEVEIRSLTRHDNSCGCPDFQVNGLGTCKHVEAVLARLRPPKGVAPDRIEVFLRRAGERPVVRAQWPGRSRRTGAFALVDRFFYPSGELRGDPLILLPELARALTAAPPRVRERIRLSHHLLPWVEEESRRAARGTARERFLQEVEAGRESLDVVKVPLYPYQREGMLHLAFTERALLADEMGLGKTVQAIAACAVLKRLRNVERVLVISPASLKAEWEEQIARFTDLPSRIVYGPRAQRLRQYGPGAFFYLASYEQMLYDADDVQQRLAPDVIVLDEAQRIKNWQSRTAHAVKRLKSPYAFVLTGTPLENRIDEIYSILQFLDPALLGPLFRFNRDFYALDDRGRPAGYKNLDELHRRLAPVLLRRRKQEVEGQLPGRTDKHYFVPMEDEQLNRYSEYEMRVAKLMAQAQRRPLTPDELDKLQQWLACMRMICDTPYILDSDCRVCPKLPELKEILGETLAEPGIKVLIFSEWERMLELVRELVQEMEIGHAWHTGSVPVMHRRAEIRRFKDDPDCRLFLSTDSGSVGLNLQAASVVINLDLPWNPARLEQRIARAWRKHQTRPVRVLHLVTEDSIEHRMIPLLAGKQALADSVLDGRPDSAVLPLPSGRKALVQRLEALTGISTTPAPTLPSEKPATPADPLAAELRPLLGDRLLDLEVWTAPDGRQTLLAVVDGTAGTDRPALEASISHSSSHAAAALELIDRSAFAAIERLIELGVLRFAAEDRRLLHRSPALGSKTDVRRDRQLAAARDLLAQSERKIRMAAVLAGGGFPVEALPALREGVDLALRSRAHKEGLDLSGSEKLPDAWVEEHLPFSLRPLRESPEVLLGATAGQVSAWIAAAEALTHEIGGALRRLPSGSAMTLDVI